MTAKLTVGGMTILSSSPASWTLRAGVEPSFGAFDVQPGDEETLLQGAPQPVRLEWDGDAPSKRIEHLYAVHAEPSENEHLGRVVLADLRYWLPYQSVSRAYNIRRVCGVRRLTQPNVPELQPVVDRVWYAEYSLKDGRPWTAREIVEDVLNEAARSVPGGASIEIAPEVFPALAVENLEINDRGDDAIRRVLSYLPGMAVTVTAAGTLRVYSTADGSERDLIDQIGPESVGGGHVEEIERARIRPGSVDVLYQRWVELRIDGEERDAGATFAQGVEGRWMENVIQVTDRSLTLPSGETVCEGAWVPLADALQAWGSVPGFGALTLTDLRHFFVPGMDPYAILGFAGQKDPDKDWISRLGALEQSWRKTWRINPRLVARVRGIKSCRVATIDPTTGTRGPATAYCDIAYMPSMRSTLSGARGGYYPLNRPGYPISGRIDEDTRAAPIRVEVLDEDQGIIRLDFGGDALRIYPDALPGMIEREGDNTQPGNFPVSPGPTSDLTDKARPFAFDVLPEGMASTVLTGNWKVAVILTVIPAAPNDDRQFCRVTITPEDVRDSLPPSNARGLADARGPVKEILVGAGFEVARVAWNDDFADQIENALGISGAPSSTDALNSLTINFGDSASGASLFKIAKSVAAQEYAEMTDSIAGSKTVLLAPGARLTGAMESVTHSVETDGTYQTVATLPSKPQRFSLWGFIPDAVRRFVLKFASR